VADAALATSSSIALAARRRERHRRCDAGTERRRARALGSERAASLSAALAPLLARVASVVDQRQPERIDAAEQEAMAHLGARNIVRLSRVSRGV